MATVPLRTGSRQRQSGKRPGQEGIKFHYVAIFPWYQDNLFEETKTEAMMDENH